MEEVTAAQAAGLTGLSERTIRRRIAAGRIPARHVAPNRYAIKVRDLPVRHSPNELAARIEALEQRVRLIELRQAALLAAPTVAAVPATDEPELASAPGVSAVGLRELLAELVSETERLTSLLMPAETAEGADSQLGRARASRQRRVAEQEAEEG